MELAARGARVLGLERSSIPNERGSSHGVNRIIRLAYAEDPALRAAAPPRVRALARAGDGGRRAAAAGSPAASTPAARTASTSVARSTAAASTTCRTRCCRRRELHRRFPGYALPDDMIAMYQPDGGFVASERAIVAHVNQALAHGAEIHAHEPVIGWHATDDGVEVQTERGRYRARQLVVTAGAWVGKPCRSCAPLFVPQRQVLDLDPADACPAEFALGAFPGLHPRLAGGPLLRLPGVRHPGLQDRPVSPPAARRSTRTSSIGTPSRRGTRRCCGRGSAATSPMRTGRRCRSRAASSPTRADEHFVIDRLPGAPQVLIVSPCSGHGYKFASVIGEIVADLVLDGGSRFDLSMFGLRAPHQRPGARLICLVSYGLQENPRDPPATGRLCEPSAENTTS